MGVNLCAEWCFFFQAEDGIRDIGVTGVQTCALPISTMLRMLDGGIDGMFVLGQNPAVGTMHSGLMRRALAQLKWLVVRDLADIETSRFCKDSPEGRSGELRQQSSEERRVGKECRSRW